MTDFDAWHVLTVYVLVIGLLMLGYFCIANKDEEE